MAFIKYGMAMLAEPVTSLPTWIAKTASKNKTAQGGYIDLSDYPVDQFLFSQATILAGVELEDNGFHVKSGFEHLVNMNGDCWTNDVALATHKSFRGSYNFLNHLQVEEESKGTILDSAPRKVAIDTNGNKSVYVDLLVATARKHHTLCNAIETNQMRAMSLGAIVKESLCTKCGKTSTTGSDYCTHLLNERRGFFVDEQGVRRIIAEVCGTEQRPDSNVFIEASWVDDPAFPGAAKRNLLTPIYDIAPSEKEEVMSIAARNTLAGTNDANYYARLMRIARKAREV